MTTITSASCMVDFGLPIWLSIIVGLCVGLLIGAINGTLVAFLGLPAFIATLGTMSATEAVALLTKGGERRIQPSS